MHRESHLPRPRACFVAGLLACQAAVAADPASPPIRPITRPAPEAARLAGEPFRGITSDGRVVPGLFPLAPSGVSTEPLRRAAAAYLDSLSVEQRARSLFPVGDLEWRRWDNRSFADRQGVGFYEMSGTQRERAFALLRAALSAPGLRTTRDVMNLNGTLGELSGKPAEYGEWYYWITVMGSPSSSEPWGFQFEGHHAIVNCFVLGDQVVMTPMFIGSEPVRAAAGRFAGTVVLQAEQDAGYAFYVSLDAAQRARATLRSEKRENNNLTEAYRDNVVLDWAGLPARDMSEPQRRRLLALIGEYVGRQREGHAKVKLAEISRHLDDTWFAWIGGDASDGVFYYRIQSPVILIEFDHQRRVAPDRSTEPTRDHIHTVVRTPNGNDYGADLLRQHLERHPH